MRHVSPQIATSSLMEENRLPGQAQFQLYLKMQSALEDGLGTAVGQASTPGILNSKPSRFKFIYIYIYIYMTSIWSTQLVGQTGSTTTTIYEDICSDVYTFLYVHPPPNCRSFSISEMRWQRTHLIFLHTKSEAKQQRCNHKNPYNSAHRASALLAPAISR